MWIKKVKYVIWWKKAIIKESYWSVIDNLKHYVEGGHVEKEGYNSCYSSVLCSSVNGAYVFF